MKKMTELKKGMAIKEVMAYIKKKGYEFRKITDATEFPVECDYEIDVTTRYQGWKEYHKTIAVKDGVVVAKWNWNC